jgi:hypothetical protein
VSRHTCGTLILRMPSWGISPRSLIIRLFMAWKHAERNDEDHKHGDTHDDDETKKYSNPDGTTNMWPNLPQQYNHCTGAVWPRVAVRLIEQVTLIEAHALPAAAVLSTLLPNVILAYPPLM